MFKFSSTLAMTVLLAGCASSGDSHFDANNADFKEANAQNLCAVYGYRWNRSREARSELESREIFSPQDWKLIEQRRLEPGMSECAMKAAFAIGYKSVSTIEAAGGSKEMRYYYSCEDGRVPNCPFTRVDIRDGEVVNIETVQEI